MSKGSSTEELKSHITVDMYLLIIDPMIVQPSIALYEILR